MYESKNNNNACHDRNNHSTRMQKENLSAKENGTDH